MSHQPVAVITGAGSGLGAAMAHHFAADGYAVAVTDIDAKRAAGVASELRRTGAAAIDACLDVTRQSEWDRLAQRVVAEWGGCNVLVNNAGVAVAGNCEDTPLEDWEWVLDVDLMGVIRGCHRFIPLLRSEAADGQQAHVVNVSSFAGFSAMPGLSAYGTAKAAVIAFSEHLKTELDEAGVGVSVVCPMFVQTNLMQTFRSADTTYTERVERWMARSGVSAEDVAAAVAEAVRDRRFLVLTHPGSRFALLLKRWWPSRYYRQVQRLSARADGRTA
ncbi:SDR family NAD(P)-dependent oxidoreductase [Elongatibacter sediminis]|uniref:SDR family NAD(P)-dependent oxidoreductase n=1 Tax=Elongatibacter sediminis TaxID=3119006 RepID=A0AAW9RCH8_9GAMM